MSRLIPFLTDHILGDTIARLIPTTLNSTYTSGYHGQTDNPRLIARILGYTMAILIPLSVALIPVSTKGRFVPLLTVCIQWYTTSSLVTPLIARILRYTMDVFIPIIIARILVYTVAWLIQFLIAGKLVYIAAISIRSSKYIVYLDILWQDWYLS
jgi:hypothetical protein